MRLKITRRQNGTVTEAPSVPKQTGAAPGTVQTSAHCWGSAQRSERVSIKEIRIGQRSPALTESPTFNRGCTFLWVGLGAGPRDAFSRRRVLLAGARNRAYLCPTVRERPSSCAQIAAAKACTAAGELHPAAGRSGPEPTPEAQRCKKTGDR